MKSISILVAAFIAVIVGLMLLGTIAGQTYSMTGRGKYVSNETLNMGAAINGDSSYVNSSRAFTLANRGIKCYNGEGSWVSGSVSITNATGKLLTSGNYTVDYTNNTIRFLNTSTTDVMSLAAGGGFLNGSNNTLVTYQYYPADYICEGWQRTVLNMVPGFFGLAILAVGVGLFYTVAKQEGILSS